MNKNQQKYQGSINFYINFPPKYQSKIQKEIWGTSEDKRLGGWNKQKVNYEKIEKSFIELTEQRNKFAFDAGYKSSVDYYVNLFKIPRKEYDSFVKNSDRIIEYCNKQIFELSKVPDYFYSEFGNHCNICLLNNFPFKSIDEVINHLYKSNKKLHYIQDKFKVIYDNESFSMYKDDIYEIHIDKNQNSNHQIIDFIHETLHLIDNPSKNHFKRELNTTKREIDYYKKYFPRLYRAFFGEFLKVFLRTLFEIQLYQKPKQNLQELYAETFNRCYRGSRQTQNRSYILDDRIIRMPFSTLPHAVALSTIILDLLKK